ncbi:MAG: chemotaxis protein CheD [Leptonema sp. (in: bacteria)]
MNFSEENIIFVGVSEWKSEKSPSILRTTVGSCVAVVLYDKTKKIGGISHSLLDEPPPGKLVNRGKYAKTSVEELIKDLEKLGANKKNLTAKIFGGASMFQNNSSSVFQNIGERNVIAAKEILQKNQIPILYEDILGHNGRTITLYLEDGRILLRSGLQEKYIYKT